MSGEGKVVHWMTLPRVLTHTSGQLDLPLSVMYMSWECGRKLGNLESTSQAKGKTERGWKGLEWNHKPLSYETTTLATVTTVDKSFFFFLLELSMSR